MSTATLDLEQILLRRLLSLAFAPPTEETLDEVDALAAALAEQPDAPGEVQALRAELALGRDGLPAAYQALFGGSVAVSLYEGSFEADPFRQARQMADVAGFYRAFGAEAGGPVAERVDHAGTELEFLAFLGARRLAAVAADDPIEESRCREIEDAFLTDHAGRWLPELCDELAASTGFYGALGRLGALVVREELATRGLEPAPLGPRRRRLAVEEDVIECAAGAGLSAPGVPEPDAPAYLRPRTSRRRRT